MDGFGIAGPDYMRTRGAARAGAAPREPNPAANPTLAVVKVGILGINVTLTAQLRFVCTSAVEQDVFACGRRPISQIPSSEFWDQAIGRNRTLT